MVNVEISPQATLCISVIFYLKFQRESKIVIIAKQFLIKSDRTASASFNVDRNCYRIYFLPTD